ncbi:MAG: C_GCAxxG_C_C family protein, partial [Firmicutes bacterium]|nr:C_GCAxxG_C_C family protein [Bacillota bacterium]
KASYKAMKELTNKFIEKNSSVVCREVKGVDSGQMLRSCNGCIQDAAEIVEEYLNNK